MEPASQAVGVAQAVAYQPSFIERLIVWVVDFFSNPDQSGFTHLFRVTLTVAVIVCTIAVIMAVLGFAYTFMRRAELNRLAAKRDADAAAKRKAIEEKKVNPRWQRIMERAGSKSESDQRMAILEADIMLQDALTESGFPGDTVSDQLKAVGSGGLKSVQNAWQAHLVRNSIAHDPAFVLADRETKRVMTLFETVFKELKKI